MEKIKSQELNYTIIKEIFIFLGIILLGAIFTTMVEIVVIIFVPVEYRVIDDNFFIFILINSTFFIHIPLALIYIGKKPYLTIPNFIVISSISYVILYYIYYVWVDMVNYFAELLYFEDIFYGVEQYEDCMNVIVSSGIRILTSAIIFMVSFLFFKFSFFIKTYITKKTSSTYRSTYYS